MPYIKAVTKAGKTILIEKYFTSRYKMKGIERRDNEHKTTEQQEKANMRKAVRELTLLMNANFEGGDYHLTLNYRPDERPATPRGSQAGQRKIYQKAEKGNPEAWRRIEIHHRNRIREEGCRASPHGAEQD